MMLRSLMPPASSTSPGALPFLSQEADALSLPSSPDAQEWKQEISKIIETRRAKAAGPTQRADVRSSKASSPTQESAARVDTARKEAAKIAAAVAARYASVPTYSELLQQRAEAAAAAAAEMAAAADAQAAAEQFANESAANAALMREALDTALASNAAGYIEEPRYQQTAELPFDSVGNSNDSQWTGFRLDEFDSRPDATSVNAYTARIVVPTLRERSSEAHMPTSDAGPEPTMEEILATSWMTPPVPLPANLIEFPREFIAARRVRPKLAEGPLRAARGGEAAQAQLRIFEVNAEAESSTAEESSSAAPNAQVAASTISSPEKIEDVECKGDWSSICLGAHPDSDSWDLPDTSHIELPLQPAPLHRRLMASLVDFCCVTGAFFSFLMVFALAAPSLPTGRPAIAMAVAVYIALGLLYQYLFFSLGRATLGMDYATIALCTFEDGNPPRAAMQRRIAAWWMAALPLGLGFLWALFDEDGLGWHDRMTRTYPRAY